MPKLTPHQRRARDKQRATERARTLRVLGVLRSLGDSLDLDVIDGEFYFRCCVPGCDEWLNAIAAQHLGDQLANADGEAFARLGASMHQLATELHTRFGIHQHVAEGFVFRDEPLRLRGTPAIVIHTDRDRKPESVTISISSTATRGQDIAATLASFATRFPAHSPGAVPDIRFRLIDAEPSTAAPAWAPHLAVSIALPLPRLDRLARALDALLPSYFPRLAHSTHAVQETALRTWSIALFMKQHGLKLEAAQLEWLRASKLPLDSNTAQNFKRERRTLFARVPEVRKELTIRNHQPLAG